MNQMRVSALRGAPAREVKIALLTPMQFKP
jgi:hypothetical protein